MYGYGFLQVQVRVWLEIPGGYPCHSLSAAGLPKLLHIPAPRPIHAEVLEALQILWRQIEEFTVLNSSGPWLAVPNHLEFIRTHLPALVSNHLFFFMVFL
jgi:hypothetical protein